MINKSIARATSAVAAVLFFLSSLLISANALDGADVENERSSGGISIELRAGDAPVVGAGFTVYPIGNAAIAGDGFNFEYAEGITYEDTVDVDAAEADALADILQDLGIMGISKATDEDGHVTFDGLPLGIYLIKQTESVSGFTDCTPFFVSIPTKDDGEWIFAIDANPKIDVSRLISLTVNKVWNTGGREHPDSVTAELYRGDVLADTAVLNAENNWSHTWNGLPESSEWTVRESEIRGYSAAYRQNGMSFTITNSDKLIQTGQLIWPIPVLAAGGILLFGIGWILIQKKKI